MKKLLYSDPVELALEWKKGLDEGRYVSRAAIAKEHGVSRARVTQILNILSLQAEVLREEMEAVTERRIRAILNGSVRDL